jgi:prepilin-type N-terminal cleavage/methylation domain-containing protein
LQEVKGQVFKRSNGFTLIELLVVIVIIGILVAIALPNFLKIKEKAKEAEVKQNLHSIQLSLERYSTDNEGLYPFYLYGGDALINIGTVWARYGKYYGGWSTNGRNPYDNFVYGTDRNVPMGDALIFEGYMTKYPKNPFTGDSQAWEYGQNGAERGWQWWYAYGGVDGKLMFGLNPYGEGVLINMVLTTQQNEVALNYPGGFWYHPRFGDQATNGEHLYWQWRDTGNGWGTVTQWLGGQIDTAYEIFSNDVTGYDLGCVGSATNKGFDVDRDTPNASPFNSAASHKMRCGYLTNGQERNPYNAANQYKPWTEGDGWGDFYIIYLNGGLDVKPGMGEADAG